MKRTNFIIHLLFVCLSLLLLENCGKHEENVVVNEDEDSIKLNYDINAFIWYNLNFYYLWAEQVPKLKEASYSSLDQFNQYLNNNTDHEAFFESLLYKRNIVDKWSWIVDDYTKLENELQGITKTSGIDFRLGYISSNSSLLFGIVRYVLKGSPADIAGVKRGDIFTKVDGQNITEDNYYTLLFERDNYTLSFASISGNQIVPNGKSISLTAITLQENPIFLDTTYLINNRKIGYLVYNGFLNDFDLQLNNTINKFKNNGINDFIIDLRYNGGGSVSTAIYLASMIYGTYTDKIFIKSQYNGPLQDTLIKIYGEASLTDYFADKISVTSGTSTSQHPINSLGMSRLYVITSNNTASASELLINGLKPYIPVTLIGDTTVGKYVASATLKDIIDSKGTVNPKHKWALQPIIMKSMNSKNESDFINGLYPNVFLTENIRDMKPLGDLNELLLSAAINYINGNLSAVQSKQKSFRPDFRVVADSRDAHPMRNQMYIDLKR